MFAQRPTAGAKGCSLLAVRGKNKEVKGQVVVIDKKDFLSLLISTSRAIKRQMCTDHQDESFCNLNIYVTFDLRVLHS